MTDFIRATQVSLTLVGYLFAAGCLNTRMAYFAGHSGGASMLLSQSVVL